MAFHFNKNRNHHLSFSKKRLFVILLLLNSLVTCGYYAHCHKRFQSKRNLATYTRQVYVNLTLEKQSIRTREEFEFIKTTLEKEYFRDDLLTFYKVVEEEFSLGLRCMRKPVQSQAIINSNNARNKQIDNSINTSR